MKAKRHHGLLRAAPSKLERALFFAAVFLMPLQLRKLLFSGGESVEWSSAFLYVTDLLLLLLFALWGERFLRGLGGVERSVSYPARQLLGYLTAAFLSFATLSVLRAESAFLGWWQLFHVAEACFFAVYVGCHVRFFGRGTVLSFFASGMVVQATAGVLQFLRQRDLGLQVLGESLLDPGLDGVAKISFAGTQGMRAYGLFPHPNIFAIYLAAALFFLCALYIKRAEEERFGAPRLFFLKTGAIYGFGFFVLMCALLLTFSRVAIGLFLVFLFFFLLFLLLQEGVRRSLAPFSLYLFVILFVCMASLFLVFRGELTQRASDIAGEDQSSLLRPYYHDVAVERILRYPVWGVGLGNFVNSYPAQRERELSFCSFLAEKGADAAGRAQWSGEGWFAQPVHNLYLLIFAEGGALLLAAFVFLIATLIFFFMGDFSFDHGVRAAGDTRVIVAHALALVSLFVFLLFLVAAFFDHYFWTSQQGRLLFGFVAGLLLSAIDTGTKEKDLL